MQAFVCPRLVPPVPAIGLLEAQVDPLADLEAGRQLRHKEMVFVIILVGAARLERDGHQPKPHGVVAQASEQARTAAGRKPTCIAARLPKRRQSLRQHNE